MKNIKKDNFLERLSTSFKKRKAKRCGFHMRGLASIIDLSLITILFLPIFTLVSKLLYADHNGREIFNLALAEAVTKEKTFSTIFHYIINDEKFLNFFYNEHGFLRIIADQLFQLFTFIAIILFFWIKKQSSPGKMLFRMKIVDFKTKEKPSNLQLTIRLFSYIISAIPLFLGFIWVVFNKNKRGWHDYIAGTQVIDATKEKSNL